MDEQRETDPRGGPMHAPQAPAAPAEPFGTLAGAEELARELVARRTLAPADLGAAILRRFDTSGAPGLHAAGMGGRFAPRPLRAAPLALTVSPYAPPQRQISAARQGAPMWRPAAAEPAPAAPAAPAAAREQAPPARAKAEDPSELPADLKSLLALHRARGNI